MHDVYVAILVLLVLCPLGCSFVPVLEVLSLEELFKSTGGDYWTWKENESEHGMVWNFTRNVAREFLHSPCEGSGNNTWQGIDCSSTPEICSSQNQSCSITAVNLFNYNLRGSLPESLSSLSQLQELVFWNNLLSGDLPSTLSLLTQLRVLDVYGNMLTGSIEPVFQLHKLTELYMSYNFFTGNLQSALSALSLLEMLYLNDNLLTGPLHPSLGQLTRVKFLDLNNNDLVGTLIPELGQLSSVERLYLNDNLLTGSLATSLGLLTQLERLDLFNCHFSGPLIAELSQMTALSKLYLNGNHLTGPILTSLGDLLLMENLDLFDNRLTGSIPVELSRLTLLERIRFEKNQLRGALPSFLGLLTRLTQLSLANNRITGPLIALPSLLVLRRLLLQNNQLSGQVKEGSLFQNSSLEVLDLSHNRLSGTVPGFVFRLPRLTTIALSLNCFQGELPVDVCHAREAMVLALDGLGGARECRHDRVILFSGVVLGGTLDGRIPSCLWSLPRLHLLHLSGNGLMGSIGTSFPRNSSLTDLALAHNKISGTIPQSLADVHFHYLDLSFNRVTGRYREMDVAGAVVVLQVNRLSGALPQSRAFSFVSELKILRDNLFGCESVPSNDEFSEDYSCASQYLDTSLYVFAAVAGLPALCLLLLSLSPKIARVKNVFIFQRAVAVCHRQLSRLDLCNLVSCRSPELAKIRQLQLTCRLIAMQFLLLLAVIVSVSLPIYCIKIWEYGADDARYSTHSYSYTWLLSMAYVTGNVPAALLLFGWMAVFAVCCFLFARPSMEAVVLLCLGAEGQGASLWEGWSTWCRCRGEEGRSTTTEEMCAGSGGDGDGDGVGAAARASLGALAFLINVAVVALVNILYVLSASEPMSPAEHLLVQVAVASFKFVYNVVILHRSATWLTQSEETNIRMQFIFSIFNKIIIPCLVTAFTSPSCFQKLIVEPDQIQSVYAYDFCSRVSLLPDGSQGDCLQYSVQEVDVIPMTPPFIYNHLCSSVLLTTYIPVYIFMFSFQIFVPVVVMVALSRVEYSQLGAQWQRSTHGMLWPSHWNKSSSEGSCGENGSSNDDRHGGDSCSATPDSLFRSVHFQLSVMNHLMILLTFGVCSPCLALVLVVSLVTETTSVMLLLGRFVENRVVGIEAAGAEKGGDQALLVLSRVQLPVMRVFEYCLWPLLATAALFFAFLCWDMAGDASDSDWKRGGWAPAVSVGAVLVASVLLHLKRRNCCGYFMEKVKVIKGDDEVAMISINSVDSSVL